MSARYHQPRTSNPVLPDAGRPLTGSCTLNISNSSFCCKYRFNGIVLNKPCGDVHNIDGSHSLTIKTF